MRVRSAVQSDCDAIADVHVEAARSAQRGSVPDGAPDRGERVALWRAVLQAGDWPVLVVERDGALAPRAPRARRRPRRGNVRRDHRDLRRPDRVAARLRPAPRRCGIRRGPAARPDGGREPRYLKRLDG